DRCLEVRPGEQVVLLTDDGTDEAVVDGLREGLGARGAVPVVARMLVPALPGSEPPTTVAAMMLEAGAIIELTSLFIGSSVARQRSTGWRAGAATTWHPRTSRPGQRRSRAAPTGPWSWTLTSSSWARAHCRSR